MLKSYGQHQLWTHQIVQPIKHFLKLSEHGESSQIKLSAQISECLKFLVKGECQKSGKYEVCLGALPFTVL